MQVPNAVVSVACTALAPLKSMVKLPTKTNIHPQAAHYFHLLSSCHSSAKYFSMWRVPVTLKINPSFWKSAGCKILTTFWHRLLCFCVTLTREFISTRSFESLEFLPVQCYTFQDAPCSVQPWLSIVRSSEYSPYLPPGARGAVKLAGKGRICGLASCGLPGVSEKPWGQILEMPEWVQGEVTRFPLCPVLLNDALGLFISGKKSRLLSSSYR